MSEAIFYGKRYMVIVTSDGAFGIYDRVEDRNVITIDGLSDEEVMRLIFKLDDVTDIDEWVDTTFEMDKPINGKHAQEYFEDRLNKVIYNE
jgi:L-fucose mutarotase/ribose pyranase (RbsD/FucU family)